MTEFEISLKRYLLEHEMKQIDIVNALGVSRSNVSQNIRSDHVTLDTMRKIVNAIGCDLEIVIKPKSE